MRNSQEELLYRINQIAARAALAEQRSDNLQAKLEGLNAQVQNLPTQGAPIVNDIRNSDWNYSTLAYTGSGVNTSAAHWYKHFQIRITDASVTNASPTLNSASALFTTTVFGYGTVRAVVYGAKADGSTISTTLTRVSDTQVTMGVSADVTATALEVWFGTELDEGATQALETTATTKANWDKTTSTALIGGSTADERFSIDQPLVGNPCTPSSRQYFQIIVRLASGTITPDLSFYVGIWDGTTGQQKWVEGTAFSLDAAKVGAHAGGTTSRTYRIIATTDYGYQLQSEDATVTNTVDPLTTDSYIALSWENLVGINLYDVYMFDGSNYFLVYQIANGSFTYFDDGSGIRPDTGFPSITATKWRGLVVVTPNDFTPTTEGWDVARATLLIPNTYDMSVTTGKQWLRMGLTANSDDLVIKLDHAALCTAPGTAWVKSKLDDLATSPPDGLPTSGDQGEVGGGTGTINPPGTGGIECISEDTPVWIQDNWQIVKRMPSELHAGMTCFDGYGNTGGITKITSSYAHSTVIITTENGARLHCSLLHPIITNERDMTGRAAFRLKEGDEIITCGETNQLSRIVKTESGGAGTVYKLSLEKQCPRFITGEGIGVLQHNQKMPQL